MDIFSMPEVHTGKEVLDCVVPCGDPHNGYIGAAPPCKKVLRPKEVAVMMVRHWPIVFGVPRTIRSDRGPQFEGGWFKALCYLMAIRHAKSIAHLGRSNGRAELAGRQCFRSFARFTSPTSAVIGLRWCGQPSRPITTPPHRVVYRLTIFSSAGSP